MGHKINRRKFLGQASCAAIGSTTFMSTLFNLHSLNASAGYHNTTDYKALVCILLSGGNDSFNMLAPRGVAEHMEYSTVRSSLALPRSSILPLSGGINNGRELGLHPSLPHLQSLYDQDKLAFICNVGSLVEPIDLMSYHSGLGRLPLGLFSHVDEIAHWQTSTPYERGRQGWAGRMADVLCTVNSNMNISMNLSISGTNLFQTGETVTPYSLTHQGSIGLNGHNGTGLFDQIRTGGIDSIFAQHYQNLYEVTYKNTLRQSQDSHLIYQAALANTPAINTVFTQTNNLAQDLRVVAQTIAARDQLGMSRQIYFINYGGWDHHDEVLNSQAKMLTVVDEALSQFYNATVELGVENDVTTFSISDFGRTLTSNGNGSDHAWGGNAFVVGGAVNGGQMYGTYPDLFLGNALDVGRGRLIPTMASDQYFAELALWFGVPKSELDMVLPNINTFYPLASTQPPVGFLLNSV